MTADQVVAELKRMGNEQTKKTLLKHGAKEPFFGVKVEDMKTIQKRVKVNHQLALDLYATGIGDAMYLAGLIADPTRMTKADLKRWLKTASWKMVSEYTVPWVASESKFAKELAKEWVASKSEPVASAGWQTYSSYVAITPDDDLDLDEIAGLLDRVQKEVHTAANRVRYTMNGFVIAVGAHVTPLLAKAKAVAAAVGDVSVDMGDTACQVPLASAYIAKIEAGGRQGKKRKSARC